MNKFIFTIIAFLFITSPLKSYGVEVDAEAIKSQEIYNEAFKKANKKDWKAVSKSLKNKEMDNEILNKTLKWMRFIDEKEKHKFDEISDFILNNKAWPKHLTLRKNTEQSITYKCNKDKIISWFETYPPLTYNGIRSYALALISKKEKEKATALIKKSWVNNNYSSKDEKDFIANFKKYLDEKDHIKRADRLLWENKINEAKRTISFVSPIYRDLFNTRIALKQNKSGIAKLLKKVPNDLKNNPGLVFDRAVYRRKSKNFDGAATLLKSQESNKGVEQKWYNEKNIVFRKYIDDKRYKDAYELFANHGFNDNSLYVHSEWNLAYVSYLFLKDYNQALIHLNNMERKSSSSVSRARVHYYSGLCLEKLGKMQDAKQEFKKGAEYSMSFYGQLSSAKSEPLIKKISRSYITANNLIDKNDEIYEKVSNHELVKAIFELKKYGQDSLVDVFTTRLGFLFNNKDEMIALANVYKNLNRPDLMVSISRQLRVIGFEMGKPAYPKPSLKIPLFADENLIYAISRQESNFNPKSISGANAMGLMQVLPSTAKEASKRLKEDFSKNRLLNDQDYNILIGSSYIEQLIKKFDGSYILAIAAYNAGPGNVNKWLKTYGKLGESEEDILMWIESIPFTETRNYVQRVLENLYIYRIINAETTSI